MTRGVLLTGATGFLGMEVLVRLLEREDTHILAAVRARDAAHARARIDDTLGRLYDRPSPALASRITALPAELTEPRLGLSRSDHAEVLDRVTSVIHCAASISFDLPLEEALAINAGGARQVLALARELEARGGLERVVHLSTAYVAGRHRGIFAEADLDVGQAFRNSYERSKLEAERALREEAAGLPLLVLRPSIVVGDRHSGWTPSFNVVYWPLRAFSRGLVDGLQADPEGILDIVPVDYVADALLALHDAPAVTGTVALVAGEQAITNAEMLALATSALAPPPSCARRRAPVGELEMYMPYLDVGTVFDDRHAREALAGSGLGAGCVSDFFGPLVDYALRAGWGKRPLTRQSAERVAASPVRGG